MDYSTQDFYFQFVSGEIASLYEAEGTAPDGVDVDALQPGCQYWDREAGEPTFIPVPELTDPEHRRYLDPLELDGLLAATVSEQARKYEFSKALHIWQHYRATSESKKLNRVLEHVQKCYTDVADKYGLSDVMQLDGGSAQEPAGNVAAAVEGPRHDVPADWPEMLRTDKAIKLAYELEKLGYLNEDWQPGPKLYFESSGDLNITLASYTAQQFKNYLVKGQKIYPVFNEFWKLEDRKAVNRNSAGQGQRSAPTEITDIVAKLNR